MTYVINLLSFFQLIYMFFFFFFFSILIFWFLYFWYFLFCSTTWIVYKNRYISMKSFDFGNCGYGKGRKTAKNRHIKKDPTIVWWSGLRRTAAAYSPTWWGSTIGDGGLNFSVRNGKRWFPAAIATAVFCWEKNSETNQLETRFLLYLSSERKGSGY